MASSLPAYDRDQLTELTGQVGLWHVTIWTVTAFTNFFHGWQMLANKFLTYSVGHWCARPPSLKMQMTASEWINISAPLLDDGSLDKCHIFDVDYSELVTRPDENTPLKDCTTWEYDESIFKHSAVQRWDLVCDRKSFPKYIQTLFFVGCLFGVLMSGVLADRFGRKVCFLSFITLWSGFGILGSFVNNVYAWTIVRFMCGAFSIGYKNILSVYMMELTHGKWRSRVNHWYMEGGWHIGHLTLGGLVYLCRNMIHLELVIGLVMVPWLSLWFLLPESPRWLLTKDCKDQALKVITQACKWNGRATGKNIETFVDEYKVDGAKSDSDNDNDSAHFFHLFYYPGMRRNMTIISLCWFSFSMSFFGLIYNTPTFGWNLFLVFVFPTFLAIPMAVMLPFIENKLGRKVCLTGSLLLSGILMLLTSVLEEGSFLIIVLAMTGQVIVGVSFSIGYNFTKELFPTVLRTTALGTASASARLGALLAPLVALLGDQNPVLPIIVYGLVGIVSGILSIWIWPETKSLKSTDTIQESEVLSNSQNSWLACFGCGGGRG